MNPLSVYRLRQAAVIAAIILWVRVAGAACGGHGDGTTLLVSPTWLNSHLQDTNLVVLAMGERSDYDAAHIPGSLFLNYPDIYVARTAEGLRMELPPVDRLVEVFEKLGVTNNSRIVLYPLKDSAVPAARVYVTLDALGLGGRTSILDGGLSRWQSEKRPVTAAAAALRPGKIEPCPQPDVIAGLDYVRANLRRAGITIVDARAPEYYLGTQAPQGKRAGHVPGAANIPFSTLVDGQGRLLGVDALRGKFQNAGAAPGDRVVIYCNIGQTASLVYFVARYLGYDARMYDGSWDEWSEHSDLPAETASPQRLD